MNKETEELILLGFGAFILLSVLNGGGTAAAKLQATQNTAYANAAATVATTAIDDFTQD